MRDNLNEKMPLDGPLVRIYMSEYVPEEENKGRKEEDKVKAVMIFKAHHAFCDGVSVMCMTLSSSADYDKSYFVKADDVPIWKRLMVRILMPFQIPAILYQTLFTWTDKNSYMYVKKDMTGDININSSPPLNLNDVKVYCRKH